MPDSTRRGFLFGMAAAVCAPAIIRPGVLMPVKQMLAIGDGVGLFAMSHPAGGIFDNTVAADLTETSLLALLQEIRRPHSGLVVHPRFIHP